MWVLVIVILNIVPGLERVTVLEKYDTRDECEIERSRIAYEMAKAYPGEETFLIACRFDSKKA